jgi:DNA/RNA endonuclease G (NUC1)
MRTLFLALLFIQTLILSAQDSIYIVETPIFSVQYNHTKQQPDRLEYRVQCTHGGVERSGDFWTDDRFETSDGYDYRDNVWDKGHLAPAVSFNCTKEMLKATFSYLNCALQHESLNRGAWARLEKFERNLAKFYEVNVIVEVLFEGDCEVLETGATVPSGFLKTIYWDDKMEMFYFPNEDTSGKDWFDFKVDPIKD